MLPSVTPKQLSYSSYCGSLHLHRPGIESGSAPWQGTIRPLDHRCLAAFLYFSGVLEPRPLPRRRGHLPRIESSPNYSLL
uniref:Uncharacterized protein n=1 Tax=Physcomitrium patens TaxID=3218 RepID=A0A2K1KHH3_PHYPA|nr:hypothetical protein PHYPA_009589 [Physcomitrium patens]